METCSQTIESSGRCTPIRTFATARPVAIVTMTGLLSLVHGEPSSCTASHLGSIGAQSEELIDRESEDLGRSIVAPHDGTVRRVHDDALEERVDDRVGKSRRTDVVQRRGSGHGSPLRRSSGRVSLYAVMSHTCSASAMCRTPYVRSSPAAACVRAERDRGHVLQCGGWPAAVRTGSSSGGSRSSRAEDQGWARRSAAGWPPTAPT